MVKKIIMMQQRSAEQRSTSKC